MRLFHVSEEDDIPIFVPRIPNRNDLDQQKGLVWAINEQCLPNYLTPRNCPRVTFHCNENTTEYDKKTYLSSETINHVIAIEHIWFERMKSTKNILDNIFMVIINGKLEVRIIDNLCHLCNKIKNISFNWSMCRMGFDERKK